MPGMSALLPRPPAASTEARVGEVLKRTREQHGLSLRTLGARAGFSASFLSQVENGQVSPSIASLEKIAGELGLTLAGLFEETQASAPRVVRAGARPGFNSTWSKARVESLAPGSERRALEALAVRLAPGGTSGNHKAGHPADQFAYVLEGTPSLLLGDERFELEPGDSVLIPRRVPHRWQNEGKHPAQVLLVSPRFSP